MGKGSNAFGSILLIAVFFLLAAAYVNNGGQGNTETHTVSQGVSIDNVEKEIFNEVNSERTARGLSILSWDPDLNAIARTHSANIAPSGKAAHEFDGKLVEGRYKLAGYACAVPVDKYMYAYGGENVHNYKINGWDEHQLAYVTMYGGFSREANLRVIGFMYSPGHKENLLRPYWKNLGVGVAIAPNGQMAVTQDFC